MAPFSLRSRTRPTAPPPAQHVLDLREWLATHAKISEDRLPTLLAKLSEHWIDDVPALCRSISALEKHLPAAAYIAINQAALIHPPPSAALAADGPMEKWAAGSVADTATTDEAGVSCSTIAAAAMAAPGGLYASPVKFAMGEDMGFADPNSSGGNGRARRAVSRCYHSPPSGGALRMPGIPPPTASPASRAGAARFLADRAAATAANAGKRPAGVSAYSTSADVRAAKAAAFRRQVQQQRTTISRTSRRALSPDGPLARVWEEWLLAAAVAAVAVAMPIDIAFGAPPSAGGSSALYDGVWLANRLIEVAFSADVFFRLCVAYREHPGEGGRWVFSRRRIAWRYLTSWMATDVLAALPIELSLWGVRRVYRGAFFDEGTSDFEPLLRLTRLLKLLRPGHVYTWLAPPRPFSAPPVRSSHRSPAAASAAASADGAADASAAVWHGAPARRRALSLPLATRALLKVVCCLLLITHWFACVWAYTGLRGAAPIIALGALPVHTPSPPTHLQHPSPPTPPTPPAPSAPPDHATPTHASALRSQCWLAQRGLLAEATVYSPATPAPPLEIYLAACLAALSHVAGIDSAVATPAGWVEQYVSSTLLLVGGLTRLITLAFLCAVLAAAAPRDTKYRHTFAELAHFCRERRLPPPIARRLKAFFRHTQRLEAATRYDLLLSRMSAQLRADTASTMATTLLRSVPYLTSSATPVAAAPITDASVPPSPAHGSGGTALLAPTRGHSLLAPPLMPPEARFLSSVVLALEPRLHCPREFFLAGRLVIIERGVAARRGHILTSGRCCGEDSVIASPQLRDAEPAIALGFCQVLTLEREALLELARPHPHALAAIRHYAVRMALRRAFIAEAHHRASQQGLVRHYGMFDEWRPTVPPPTPPPYTTHPMHAQGASGGCGGEQLAITHMHQMCAAMEARLHAKLSAVVTAAIPTAAVAQPAHPKPPTASATIPQAVAPTDALAAAWPCTLQDGGGGRRRRSARSVDGADLPHGGHHGRSGHRAHSTAGSTRHHRAHSTAGSTRSMRHHYSHRAATSELLARIERLESAAPAAASARTAGGAVRGLVQRFSSSGLVSTVPVTVPQFPQRAARPDGSQSPPLSAEGRARRALEEVEQQRSGGWDA